MRRGQIQQSMMMVFTVILVGVLVYVGYRGVDLILSTQQDEQLRSFWNDLDEAIRNTQNPGAERTHTLMLPEGRFVCFFDLGQPDRDCVSGDTLCAELEGYFAAAGDLDGNVVLNTGENHRNDIIALEDRYLCFEGPRIDVRLIGQGRSTLVTVP